MEFWKIWKDVIILKQTISVLNKIYGKYNFVNFEMKLNEMKLIKSIVEMLINHKNHNLNLSVSKYIKVKYMIWKYNKSLYTVAPRSMYYYIMKYIYI